LRQWLNESFLDTAFIEKEQAIISASNDGKDYVSLLNVQVVKQLLNSDEERKCTPTSYAIAQGCNIHPNNGNCWWWLQTHEIPSEGKVFKYSSGDYSNVNVGTRSALVDIEGSIRSVGDYVNTDHGAVRPAIWIDLKEQSEGIIERVSLQYTDENNNENDSVVLKNDDPIVQHEITDIKKASVGDYVLFGSYEQDDNSANGKEAIEWIVLNIQNNRALLLSCYALDRSKFNTSFVDKANWGDSSMRSWLNGTFINNDFSKEERAIIPTVSINTNKVNTKDQVFVLSVSEVNSYFGSDEERLCEPTEYALSKGCPASGENCWWWLRTQGSPSSWMESSVNPDGSVNTNGHNVISQIAVRPAMWIDLNKVG
jgi:hypothetical protein